MTIEISFPGGDDFFEADQRGFAPTLQIAYANQRFEFGMITFSRLKQEYAAVRHTRIYFDLRGFERSVVVDEISPETVTKVFDEFIKDGSLHYYRID